MSFLNASTEVKNVFTLPPHLTKAHALTYLHDGIKMFGLNPSIKSCDALPSERSKAFFRSVAPEHKPPASGPEEDVSVYYIVETTEEEGAASGGSWRGGWAKRFVPNTIEYESSFQSLPDGMLTLTHAPLGVSSVTDWTVSEVGERVLVMLNGKVTSNRMLMTFIKTTLQGSYDKLAADFLSSLERDHAESSTAEL